MSKAKTNRRKFGIRWYPNGEIYLRVHWNNRGKKSIVWRCVSRLENTGFACHSRTASEDLIGAVVTKAINDLLGQKDDFLGTLKENI